MLSTLKKLFMEMCSFCGAAATLWIFYLSIFAANPISVTTIRYIAILALLSIIGPILSCIEIKWSWNNRYFKNNTTDDNDCE